MNKVLVSVEERNWIKQHASIEMGKVVKQRVVDLDKVVQRIREGRSQNSLTPYVDIVPVSADQFKIPNKMPTYQKDPVTGVLYGIPIGEDDYGNIKWQRLQLTDSLSLNLDNEMDARIWAVIRFNPDIAGSPFQKANPYYKIFDPVDQAIATIGEAKEMQIAFDRVRSLTEHPKEMVFFARYLGEDIRENANKQIVEGILLQFAKNFPAEFNKKFNAKERSYAERFYTAKAIGVIESHPDRGFLFRNVPIGFSDEEAIKTLSTDSAIMSAVNTLIIENDKVMRIVLKETSYEEESVGNKPKKGKEEEKEEEVEVLTAEEVPVTKKKVMSVKTNDEEFE